MEFGYVARTVWYGLGRREGHHRQEWSGPFPCGLWPNSQEGCARQPTKLWKRERQDRRGRGEGGGEKAEGWQSSFLANRGTRLVPLRAPRPLQLLRSAPRR